MLGTGQADTPLLLSTSFSVNDLPADQRYEVWRDSISCIFDVDPGPRSKQDGDFFASIDAHMLGSLMLARTHTRHQLWARSATAVI